LSPAGAESSDLVLNKTEATHVLVRALILDQDHVLVCKTLDLPTNFYFFPGGHIENGESAVSALMRELQEETGAECKVKRFLGCLEYIFEPGNFARCHNHKYSFLFEAESDSLKLDLPLPQVEPHLQLLWVPLTQINDIDFRPAPLKKLIPVWLKAHFNGAFGG